MEFNLDKCEYNLYGQVMKYVILRVVCKFSDGSLRTIKYDENHVTEENACNDVAQFKKNLKDKLNRSLQILGVTVSSINLTYEERDGRQ